MKNKFLAYLLWLPLGWTGIHRMYCGNWGTGIIWFLTGGLLGVGWAIDLFLTSVMVDMANLKFKNSCGTNVTVNMVAPVAPVQK